MDPGRRNNGASKSNASDKENNLLASFVPARFKTASVTPPQSPFGFSLETDSDDEKRSPKSGEKRIKRPPLSPTNHRIDAQRYQMNRPRSYPGLLSEARSAPSSPKRSRFLAKQAMKLDKCNQSIKDFLFAAHSIANTVHEDMSDFLNKIASLTFAARRMLQAIQWLGYHYMHHYEVDMDEELAANCLAYAAIHFHVPRLITCESYYEAALVEEITKHMILFITELSQQIDRRTRNNSMTQFSVKAIVDTLERLAMLHEKVAPWLQDYPEKVRADYVRHLMRLLVRNSTTQKLIENHPGLQQREMYDSLSTKSVSINEDLAKLILQEEEQEFKCALAEVEQSEPCYDELSRLERLHQAALNPSTLLKQYNSDHYAGLKMLLKLELSSQESDNRLLYKVLMHLRRELTDLLPSNERAEVNEAMKVPLLVAAIAARDADAMAYFEQQFSYILSTLMPRLFECDAIILMKKVSQIKTQLSDISAFISVLPEAIVLALESILLVEKKRFMRAIASHQQDIRADMLTMELETYKSKLQDCSITYDTTQKWMECIFNNAEGYNLVGPQKYSQHGGTHLFSAGLLSLITAKSINRLTLPDTLFLDYRNLLTMQKAYNQFIQKLISYQTILVCMADGAIHATDEIKIQIQEAINASIDFESTDISTLVGKLVFLLKVPLEGLMLKADVISSFSVRLSVLLRSHFQVGHPVNTIINQRAKYIIKRLIKTQVLDYSVLKIDGIDRLTDNFSRQLNALLPMVVRHNLKIHGDVYSSMSKVLQLNELVSKITRQYARPHSPVPGFISDLSEQCKLLSLVLTKVGLLATCLSTTIQFVNHLVQDVECDVTASDIKAYIKKIPVDFLFNREGVGSLVKELLSDNVVSTMLSDENVEELLRNEEVCNRFADEIKDYHALPLLSAPGLSMKNMADHVASAQLEDLTQDESIGPENLIARFIVKLPNLLASNGMTMSQTNYQNLSDALKKVLMQPHPGFQLYQAACAQIAFRYCLNRQMSPLSGKRWAALSVLRPVLDKLCEDIGHFIEMARKRANEMDEENVMSMIPQQLKTGFK